MKFGRVVKRGLESIMPKSFEKLDVKPLFMLGKKWCEVILIFKSMLLSFSTLLETTSSWQVRSLSFRERGQHSLGHHPVGPVFQSPSLQLYGGCWDAVFWTRCG